VTTETRDILVTRIWRGREARLGAQQMSRSQRVCTAVILIAPPQSLTPHPPPKPAPWRVDGIFKVICVAASGLGKF